MPSVKERRTMLAGEKPLTKLAQPVELCTIVVLELAVACNSNISFDHQLLGPSNRPALLKLFAGQRLLSEIGLGALGPFS